MKLSRALLKATLVAALGGLLFGFDTIVISGVQQAVKCRVETTLANLQVAVYTPESELF